MEKTGDYLTNNLSDNTDSILFPDMPEHSSNTEAYYFVGEPDYLFGIFGNKQKRAEKKLEKAEKKLEKGKTAKAEKKFAKAEKLLKKSGSSLSNPNDTLTSRIAEDIANISFNKNSGKLIGQQQKQLQDAMTQNAISQMQSSVGQMGLQAGNTTPYADTSGVGSGGGGDIPYDTTGTGATTDTSAGATDTSTGATDATTTQPKNNYTKYILIGVAVIALLFLIPYLIKRKK
jgi:cobalamin biosynthesis Mg chelatase CobN